MAPPARHPGGQVGSATIRFQGSGADAHLDVGGESVTVPAGSRGTWTVSYQADAWPVQPGGSITIWKWAPKFVFGMALQDTDPTGADYCSAYVTCGPERGGVTSHPPEPAAQVELTDLTPHYKRYRQATLVVRDHTLASGDSVSFVAGDTTGGAPPCAVIAYSAADVAIDVQVDHDGDGHPETHHRLWIHVGPGPAARLRATVPSVLEAGEAFPLTVHVEDRHCNPGAAFTGTLQVHHAGTVLAEVRVPVAPDGTAEPVPATAACRLDGLRLAAPGVHRLEVVARSGDGAVRLETRTNPVRVLQGGEPSAARRIFWGEMHNHTTWCEGMATVEENYAFARDSACLDWYSASEHIMLGPGRDFPITDEDSPPASSAAYWRICQDTARRFHQPGRFVTFIGYEWTALLGYNAEGKRHTERQTWGDHCAWFVRDDQPLVIADSLEGELAVLARLAHDAAARGEPPPGMIIPHPGGGATDWTHYRGRDLVAMPLVETCSQHAHTEWFYQRALATGRREGFRLGVCGMDDGHMGHPGYDVWSRHGVNTLRERAYSVQGGLTAVVVPTLTRADVWAAFFDRRTYATSGERILLEVWVENAATAGPADPRHAWAFRPAGRSAGQHPGGSGVERLTAGQAGSAAAPPRIRVQASGTAPLDLVEIMRDDRLVYRRALAPDTWDVELTWTDERPSAGETAYYVRVTQTGDAFAWSSPIWLTYTGERAPDDAPGLPAWNDGIWPPDGDEASREEAKRLLPALVAFLSTQGAAGTYVDLHAVGILREHRGRYALFRGRDRTGAPVHILYYPDFDEDRVRIGMGWADYGVGPGGPRYPGEQGGSSSDRGHRPEEAASADPKAAAIRSSK